MDETKLAAMFEALGNKLVECISKAVAAPVEPKAPVKNGKDGKDGKDGKEGKDGNDGKDEPVNPVQAAIEKLEKPKVPDDVTSPTAMDAFARAQSAYELKVRQIKGELTAAEVAEMVKSMTAKLPSDEECGIEADDSPRERELKRQLFEVKKSRNAPEDNTKSEEDKLEEVRKSRSTLASSISGAYNATVGAEGRSFRKVKAGA